MGMFDKIKDAVDATSEQASKAAAQEQQAGASIKEAADQAKEAAERAKREEAKEQAAQKKPDKAAAAKKKAAKKEPRTVTVKSGDTLSGIAAKHGVDWREMAKLNDLDNPDLIYPGQVFKLPKK